MGERDTRSRERDAAAVERDRAAEVRDRRADACDEAARAGDHQRGSRSAHDLQRAPEQRARAAAGRAEAAHDRLGAARDREQAAQDRDAAAIDELTGVRRRGAGLALLQGEIDRSRRASERLVAAFVDVDGLKAVNDSEGHRAGDRLLNTVGSLLKGRVRSYDLIVRVGGDELVCVLPDVAVEDLRLRIDAVNRELAGCWAGGSLTVGFAQLEPGDTPEDLVGRADADLLSARSRRRGLGRS
jgi:diguanylate cyclase (GGDEF)-like protein